MTPLVIVMVTLLAVTAGQQYDPYRGASQFRGPPQYNRAAEPQYNRAAEPHYNRAAEPQYNRAAEPQYNRAAESTDHVQHSGQGQKQGPVGGPAPLDAVQKATEEFKRLYKEAAARAAAAPDDPQTYEQQQPVHVPQQPVHVPQQPSHVPRQHAPRQHAPRQHAPRQHAPQQHAPRQHVPRPQFHGPSPSFHGARPAFGGPRYTGSGAGFERPAAAAASHVTGPPQPVQDTPEVAAAKAAFHKEFRQRAELAAAAPDNHDRQRPPALYRPELDYF